MQLKHFQGYAPMFIAANCKSFRRVEAGICLAPKARNHLSLGHRPRELNRIQTSAESAIQSSSGIPFGNESRLQCWSFSHSHNPGALPQALNERCALGAQKISEP
jgi:hypothetical protein